MHNYIKLGLLVLLSACTSKSSDQMERVETTFSDLVWADEFDKSTLDTSKWKPIVGDGCPDFCGFGNNELQYYSDRLENLQINDGTLVIRALKDSLGNRSYSSAKLISKNKGDWKYGRIEVKAKLPEGRGTWPAIWMMPTLDRNTRWPADGEIDIMEHVGYNQGMVYGAAHNKKYNGMLGTQKVDSLAVLDVHQKFHVYMLEWTENRLTWLVDGEPFFTFERDKEPHEGWPYTSKFHLILNLAVGGNWGGKFGVDDSIWPQQLEVDYVRVYQ